MPELLFLALAGALGSVSRYGLSELAFRLWGSQFAYGTLIVNVLGCLLIGFLMHLAHVHEAFPQLVRFAVIVGFLGAFTTFSTFSYETVRYLQDGAWTLALLNVGTNLIIGLGATWGGILLGRLAVGHP